ncbi:hypothetical protein D7Z26_14155 [Cohnella endophytica]|uniref:Glycoside hydrolase n=1 Tax=Cohnella endophytica TaxID=2419778 RepID=A0A494XXS5_9BACL|nr:glycosyl hydrolase [Cohnella endophytica]RKP52894.1 hypothetical protein D7Z26_14155 [Cohnella endophytica]
MDKQLFNSPSVDFRPVPFWSWNGKLSKERLLQQIHSMQEAGMGGFFMHARSGLSTPYLQEDWFACVKSCVDEADLLGMKAWIYDENGWPSGYAGGAVPRMDRAFRAKALVMEAVQRAEDDEYRLIASRPAEDGKAANYYYEWVQPLGQERFELASYVDLLHPQVTQAFIESTHNRYKDEVGHDFAGTIPGVFSDEACALLWLDPSRPALPWTEGFAAIFYNSYGYDLIPLIHYLFIEEESYKKVRYDYWRLVMDLFAENYAKAVYQWCEAEGLFFTGHLMAEDNLVYQMEWVGDVMRQYEYMHIPGLDHLGRQIHKSSMELSEASYTTVLSAKQVSSIAHQLGKERCLSELFACAGQGFDPGLQKWMIDWHLVHGINLFSPHLLPYSFAGEGKRDYPPTIGPQQPWWKDYKVLSDYQARMCYALTRGKRVAHLLVLHPIESAFAEYSPLNANSVNQKNADLERLSLLLLDHHLDFDFGNEHFMGRYGEVTEDGIRVGGCVYRTVIIPDCSRFRPSTLRLLQLFAEKGGKIWATTALEELRNGMPDINGLAIHPFSVSELAVEYPQGAVIEGADSRHIWMHERIDGDDKLFFMANLYLSHEPVQVTIKLEGYVKPLQLNAETGETLEVPFLHQENKTIIEWVFLPKQSLLIQAVPCEVQLKSAISGKKRTNHRSAASAAFTFKPLDLNTVVLDTFFRKNQADLQWEASASLAHWRRNQQSEVSGEQYKAYFAVDDQALSIPLYAVVEAQLGNRISCNGQDLQRSSLTWLDADWICYEIPRDLLIAGDNSLELELIGNTCGLMENIYVIGEFQVYFTGEGLPLIVKPDYSSLRAGNLTDQGFPFYAGRMELLTLLNIEDYGVDPEEEKWCIRISQSSIASAVLWVNGVECGVRAWDPWEWEINKAELGNSCELRLVISNTLRNLIGPHHYQNDDQLNFITPSHFWDMDHWSEERILVPFGVDKLYLEKEILE